MREACGLTAKVLDALDAFIRPAVSTLEIDRIFERFIIDTLNARPASKGQYDYPYSVNTSINHVVCHGMPNNRALKNGDIINVNVTGEKMVLLVTAAKRIA